MKRILLCTLMLVFAAGSVVPAALAFECDMLAKSSQSEQMQDTNENMPCHEPENNNTDHCEGVCLCLSLSLSQNQLFETAFLIKQPAIGVESYAFIHETVRSTSPLPLYKPPITLA